MKKILVSSTNSHVIETVKAAYKKYSSNFDAVFCTETEESLSFINYELPEIKVLDFTCQDIDSHRILDAIDSDPWLHNGGIIAVVENAAKVQEIEDKKDPNILIVQTVSNFKENFHRLLRILWSSPQFLFNRGMQERVGAEEKGVFICGNDPLDIRLYTNLLVNYLYFSNTIDEETSYGLQTALNELLTNALEHGNLNISYDEKTAWLMEGKNMLDLLTQKSQDPRYKDRRIHINYLISDDKTQFCISDDGDGFDWRSHLNNDFTEETHGRGMKLSNSLVTQLMYNDKGNTVKFEIKNLMDSSNYVPQIVQPFDSISYKKHEIVFRQDDESNDLFFIVSGRFGVYSNGKLITVLTPEDMFIGEMAFLLNDRRSATVMSAAEGKLIKIPKTAFINIIRQYPHYGIFLSKLLAQRIAKNNKKMFKISKENEDLKKELDTLKNS